MCTHILLPSKISRGLSFWCLDQRLGRSFFGRSSNHVAGGVPVNLTSHISSWAIEQIAERGREHDILLEKSFKLSCIYVVKRIEYRLVFTKMQVACLFAIDEKSRRSLKLPSEIVLRTLSFVFSFDKNPDTPSLNYQAIIWGWTLLVP